MHELNKIQEKVLDQGTASVVIRLLRLDWLIQLFSNDPQKGLLWFSVLVVPYIAGNMGSGLAALGSKKPRLTLRLLVPIYVGLIGLLIVASQLANPLATPKNLKANSLERVGAVMRRTGFDEVKISQLLTRGGTVVAWGGNQSGQCNVPPGLTNVVALAAGVSHSVALTVNGTVVAWGGNEFGQATAPFKLSSVVAIGAGEFHTVALKADGSVVAWGAGMSNQPKIKPGVPRGWVNYGQSTVPRRLGNAIGVAAGGFHAMAIKADGSVRAWGAGASLDGKKYWWDYNQSVIPVDLKRVVAIAAGEIHSLALTDDGHVVAWGGNTDAAEWWDGGHNLNQIQVPEEVRDIVAIAAGDYHSLALKNDGGVVGWGAGSSSLDHRYNKGQARIPTDLRSVVAIAANGLHSVALKRNGQVIAWGYNEDGQCNVPVGLSNVGAIAAGYGHTLAIKLDDDVALAAPVQLSQTLSAPAQPMIVSGQKPSESPMNVRISQGRVQIRTASGAAVDIDDQSTSHSPLDGEALQSEIQPTQFEDFVIRAAVAEVKTNTVNSRSSKSKADTSTLSWSGILPAN